MSARDTGGPAFPCDVFDGKKHTTSAGMELRDYFAAKAMHAVITGGFTGLDDKKVAVCAYEIADAMLKARQA